MGRATIARSCIILALALAAPAMAAPAAGPRWQLVGKTYNSVAFVDRTSMAGSGPTRLVRVMRVSGQPDKDGWLSVNQQLRVGCADRVFGDEGSIVENADGSQRAYPPTPAIQPVPARGMFKSLFEAVCQGAPGPLVEDPKAWTRQNFKPGA
jgi:hypothetical protein